jgi:uncharacterized lipoprotein YbaY
MIRNTLCGLALAAAVMLGACSSSKTEVLPPTVNVSIGQQLIDLKKAKDSGVISESAYQVQVRRVIDSVK